MYCVFLELIRKTVKWKSGTMRDVVGTQAAGEFFHSFFKFSKTFMFIIQCVEHVCYFFQKTLQPEKGKQHLYFDDQNVNSLC